MIAHGECFNTSAGSVLRTLPRYATSNAALLVELSTLTFNMHSPIGDPLFSKRVTPVSLKPLFVKAQQFEKLRLLQRKYLDRKVLYPRFCEAIERILYIMVADWQILVVRCRFLESTTGHYTELHSREAVICQLVHLLVIHDTILSYLESSQDTIDLQGFESDFLGLVDVLHERSKTCVKLKKLVPALNSKRQQDQWRELSAMIEGNVCKTIWIDDWIVTHAKDLLDPTTIVIECDEGVVIDVSDAGLSSLSSNPQPRL